MTAETTFDATQDTLANLLTEVANGQLQLPDFQRGWVWDDEHISSVITSIARSFPVGAIMTLQTGGEVKFAPRYFEGADLPKDGAGRPTIAAARLVLDGQQRLTSLFQALSLKHAIRTRDEKRKVVDRFYYVDIQKALGDAAEREAAVFSIPDDKRVTRDFGKTVIRDLSTAEHEYQSMMFPLNQRFARSSSTCSKLTPCR